MSDAMAGEDAERDECRTLEALRAAEDLRIALKETTGTELHRQSALRHRFPADLVRAALALEELRTRAAGKFERAESMWFDRTGLEQSTSEPVARYKARRFDGPVWDLCCGIGGDSLALAARGPTMAVDLRPSQILRTRWNAEAYGVGAELTTRVGDVASIECGGALVHIDPDRRPGGRARSVRVEDSIPGLDFLESLMSRAAGGAIKLSPASNFPGKFPDAEIELISLRGECKEATVWFGSLAAPGEYRATALPAGVTLAGRPLDWSAPRGTLEQYLYDPDPALVRAGLVDMLAEQGGLRRLDDAEEYLTSDIFVDSPFLQPFEVVAEVANNPKEIRAAFRATPFGQVEIKCRHLPVRAEEVRRTLPLTGDEPGALVFARIAGKARAIICRRVGRT